jgi:hypothetical protein
MGSYIETNDTLQITSEQGFPKELVLEEHLKNPFTAEQFAGRVFEFRDKPSIRIYHAPPVRNFLAENKNGKWIYWGLVYILEVVHDYEKKTTSGKFKIIRIYSPDEMKKAHDFLDQDKSLGYFA